MSKAKNWIFGAVALFILTKVFGNDTPAPVSPPDAIQPQTTIQATEQAPQPLGFVQATTHRLTNQPPPSADQHPFIGKWLYSTAKVNMRSEPSLAARVITVIERGRRVQVMNYRSGWFSVTYANRTGWISELYLAENPPPVRQKPVSVPRIMAPPAATHLAPARRSGQPVRSPYIGTCDCPYDVMRNGRSCGGRSAYSRPGGRSPVCYR
ncbi:SH3 domain-containing protein [Brucella lupini]|uniref:SH3 domain-containing protein n=2 Tax=Brucella TaxID=234 RepID=A0AB34DMR6_9HYPH|nr:SH3 domain-containing protein [Brucella lupini]